MHVVLVAESFIKVFHYIKCVTLFFFSALPSGHLAHISGEDEVPPPHIRKSQVIIILLKIRILQLYYSIQNLSSINI